MSGYVNQNVVKTRKAHRCVGCLRLIPKGLQTVVVVSVDMGKIFSSYWCDDCSREEMYDDVIMDGEFADREYAQRPIEVRP